MKKILKYLHSYFTEEVKPLYFISVVVLVAVSVYFEYTLEMEKNYVMKYWGDIPRHFLANAVMYGIPFIGSYLLYIVFYKRWDILKNKTFWGVALFALAVYCLRSSWFGYREWVRVFSTEENYYYNMRTFNQIAQAMMVFLPVVVYWFFVHRKQQNLYGFKVKGVDFKPYFGMLIFMIPLITWASFQTDFLSMYPVYQRIIPEGFSSTLGILKVVFFELCYGVDFVMTEFFFRGFLILAFAPIVGRACILPMVAFYVFIHFGKPLGETISSFFGGLLLGVIAYETRSIIGGIIVHLGIAWMMETGGTFGRELGLADKKFF
jgi:hypothetical protein